MRIFFLFLFLALLMAIISIRVYELYKIYTPFIGIPLMGILHTIFVGFEVEACHFYETYSKCERVTLFFDVFKYAVMIWYIFDYSWYDSRLLSNYLILIPLFQKIIFYIALKRKYDGIICSPANIFLDFFCLIIGFRGLYKEANWWRSMASFTIVFLLSGGVRLFK